jgi:hypothetical protein
MCDDPNVVEEPDAWAVLEPTASLSTAEAVELITNSLGNDALPT